MSYESPVYRFCRAIGFPTSAETARIRLFGVVAADRAAVPCGRWHHVRSGLRVVLQPNHSDERINAMRRRYRKAVLRWKVRR